MKLLRTGDNRTTLVQTAFAYKTPLGLLLVVRSSCRVEVRRRYPSPDAEGRADAAVVEIGGFIEEHSGGDDFARDADSVLFIGETAEETAALGGAVFATSSRDWWGRPPAVYALMMPSALLAASNSELAHYPPAEHLLESLHGCSRAVTGGRPSDDARSIKLAEFTGDLPPKMRSLLSESGHGRMEVSRMPGGSLMATFIGSGRNSEFLPVQLEGAPCGGAAFMFDGRMLVIEAEDPKDRQILHGEQFNHFEKQSFSYLYPAADFLEQATLLARLD